MIDRIPGIRFRIWVIALIMAVAVLVAINSVSAASEISSEMIGEVGEGLVDADTSQVPIPDMSDWLVWEFRATTEHTQPDITGIIITPNASVQMTNVHPSELSAQGAIWIPPGTLRGIPEVLPITTLEFVDVNFNAETGVWKSLNFYSGGHTPGGYFIEGFAPFQFGVSGLGISASYRIDPVSIKLISRGDNLVVDGVKTDDGLYLIKSPTEAGFQSLFQWPDFYINFFDNLVGITLYDHNGEPLLRPVESRPVEVLDSTQSRLHIRQVQSYYGLELDTVWTADETGIELTATITNIDGSLDRRAVEACLRLPIYLLDWEWYWQHDIDEFEPIEERTEPYETLVEAGMDVWINNHKTSDAKVNLHGLNVISSRKHSLGIALTPQRPAAYYVQYHSSPAADKDVGHTLTACFPLGILADHKKYPNRAVFGLTLMHAPVPQNEPRFAYRGLLKKLFDRYPDNFRGVHPELTGMLGDKNLVNIKDEYFGTKTKLPYIDVFWQAFPSQVMAWGGLGLMYLCPDCMHDRNLIGEVVDADPASVCLPESNVLTQELLEYERSVTSTIQFYKKLDICLNVSNSELSNEERRTECTQYVNGLEDEELKYASSWATYCDPNLLQRKYMYKRMGIKSLPKDNESYLNMYDKYRFAAALEDSITQIIDYTDLGLQYITRNSRTGKPQNEIVRGWVNQVSGKTTFVIQGLNPDPGTEVEISDNPDPLFIDLWQSGALPQPANWGLLNLDRIKRLTGVYPEEFAYIDPGKNVHIFSGVALDVVGTRVRRDINPNRIMSSTYPLTFYRETGDVASISPLMDHAFYQGVRRSLNAPNDIIAVNGKSLAGLGYSEADIIYGENGAMSDLYIQQERIDPAKAASGTTAPAFADGTKFRDWTPFRYKQRITNSFRMWSYKRPITFSGGGAAMVKKGTELEPPNGCPPGLYEAPGDRMFPVFMAEEDRKTFIALEVCLKTFEEAGDSAGISATNSRLQEMANDLVKEYPGAMSGILDYYTAKGIYVALYLYLPGYLPNYEASPLFHNKVFADHPDHPIRKAYYKHLDAVYDLSKAGWEPVPYVTPLQSGNDIIVERFGPGKDGHVYITLFNSGQARDDLALDIDWRSLGFQQPPDEVWLQNGTANPLEWTMEDICGGANAALRCIFSGDSLRINLLGHFPSARVAILDISLRKVTGVIDPSTGGIIQSSDLTVSLDFPGGAVTQSTAITVTRLMTPTAPIDGYQAIGQAIDIQAEANGEEVTQFEQPFILGVTYQDQDWPSLGIADESELNLYYWDGSAWRSILPCDGCNHDTAANRFVARLDHLTEFAILHKNQVGLFLPIETFLPVVTGG